MWAVFPFAIWACVITIWIIVVCKIRRRRHEFARERERQMTAMADYQAAVGGSREEILAMALAKADQQAAAKVKARDALLGFLDAFQRNDYMQYGYFDVRGQSGALYRLWNSSYIGNIEVLPSASTHGADHRSWTRNAHYCVHLEQPAWGPDTSPWAALGPNGYPIEDHLLAQALMLKTNESELLAIAHRYN